MNRSVCALLICVALLLLPAGSSPAARRVGVVTDTSLAELAAYGLGRLLDALQERGFEVQRLTEAQIASSAVNLLVIAGQSPDRGVAFDMLKASAVLSPEGPEVFVVHRTAVEGKPAVILWGSDVRGLMYAALDVADRVSWSEKAGDPFAHIRDMQERPYVRERAVSIYTMQRGYFESRLYDETYW